MEKETKELLAIFLRYGFLFIIGLFAAASSLFYNTLLPLTIYPVNFLLSIFYSSSVIGSTILSNSSAIEIISACVAVSAYLLLLILNLATPMSIKKRIYSLLFSFVSLLILNILRIFILSVLFINKFTEFEAVHMIFWFGLSIVFVIAIWFLEVHLFKIKQIPFYRDFKILKRIIKDLI